MRFHTSMLTVLAPLVAMTCAFPVSFQVEGEMSHVNYTKRIPCAEASDKAASAEYKRDTTSAEDEDEDALGDDSPGTILACAF